MIPYNKKLASNARALRKSMTPEEKHIWYDFLRRLPLSVKRQHCIGDYIVDFYIPEKKTVLEIDGLQHTTPEHREADRLRDAALLTWGITVLRYTNADIRDNFHSVVADILKKLDLCFADLKA